MQTIIVYGTISGLSLLVGALIGNLFKIPQRIIAAVMAFGSGALICALTFGLMEEAFKHGGFGAVILGFLVGGSVFILGDYILHLKGARHHKRRQLLTSKYEPTGQLITLGAILDAVPESIALGIALYSSQASGLLMMAAIVLSNLPESLASISGLKKEGFSREKIYAMWGIVALATLLISVASFVFLKDLHPLIIGSLEAFAAGAILAMLADSIMPEAFEQGGFLIGLATMLGFLATFLISKNN